MRRVDHTRRRSAHLFFLFFPRKKKYAFFSRRATPLVCYVLTFLPAPPRVDHHRAARAFDRVDGTPQRVRQDKVGVGDLRRCDPPRAGRDQSEEGRTGTARWRLGQDHEEWLGITSPSFTHTKTEMINQRFILCLNRLNLSRPHSKSSDSGTLIDPSLEFSSAHRYVKLPLFGVVALRSTMLFFFAQVISELLPAAHEPLIEVVSRIPESLLPDSAPDGGAAQSVVALRQGRHLLTTFHPELTDDSRFHEYFVHKCVLPSLAS